MNKDAKCSTCGGVAWGCGCGLVVDYRGGVERQRAYILGSGKNAYVHVLPEPTFTGPLDTATLARAIMDRVERDGAMHLSSIEDEIRRAQPLPPLIEVKPSLHEPEKCRCDTYRLPGLEVSCRVCKPPLALGAASERERAAKLLGKPIVHDPPPGLWLDELKKIIGVHMVAKNRHGTWFAHVSLGHGVMLPLALPHGRDAASISPAAWLDRCEAAIGVRPGGLRGMSLSVELA